MLFDDLVGAGEDRRRHCASKRLGGLEIDTTSLARPGGNITGVSLMSTELMPKRLELVSELVPQAATERSASPKGRTA